MTHRLRHLMFPLIVLVLAAACGGSEDEADTILFLHPGPNGSPQLFSQTHGDATSRQLTGNDNPAAPEVIDFAASPDGERILYAAIAGTPGGGGTDTMLRAIDVGGGNDVLVLDCPAAECAGPVWSPDGDRVIYERRPWEGDFLGSPRLHWLDPATGETLPLIEGNETPGYGARFSPDGRWLSYVSLADEGLVLYELAGGRQRLLSSRVGSPAAWSPDSAAVVYGDLVVQGHATAPAGGQDTPVQESSTVFLYRTVVADEAGPRERLSPDAGVADSVPAYSPDGAWIAFGRTPANTAAGRQLWIMRPDGGEARALTNDPAITHGPPGWSADGRTLIFQRYALADPAAVTSVWQLDVTTGEVTQVSAGGYLPAWLP